ncbi:Group II intron-encoded protein LtrA [Maioricimonas rarisocia]|uniref:RNA-directed DNA polymerase n=2 Tax=Maioricimonas rarisocia TaxID=2528026 RepID=A0A517Z9V1_9PLAN|nr:Group II intron-encoded protein LtrA [Maioricimonas rarisocia]
MSAERQQGGVFRQLLLFGGHETNAPRPGDRGEGGTETATCEERQTLTAMDPARALTQSLMEEVTQPENLNRAYRRVKANRGAPGVDGMTIAELPGWIAEHTQEFIARLLDGSYQPQPVRGVEIPKPGGGMRQLGIPTVVDRLVQQAILQVLEPILDPTFSDSSYGFRPRRSAHQAVQQASEYVAEGRTIVVDMDLEKFFDRVNHDILMARLARRVADKRLLRIVRRFLEAGLLQNGVCVARHEGTPQGGPLSPLLANLLLDDLDRELERRGHKFCRYADDCNIYVQSQAAGERVLTSLTMFLEGKLRLRVNREKSAVAVVSERKFLGYRLLSDGRRTIAPASLRRARQRIRQITRRNRGISFERMIGEVNSFTTGWVTYFRHALARSPLRKLDGWIRRKLRCVRLKQRKRAKSIAIFLQSLGVPWNQSWTTATCGKGWWRKSGTPSAHHGMSNQWFDTHGYQSLEVRYLSLQH